jgi:predicted RNA-binding Zn-ribbon protein involved in translation (DUF1610 family)
MTTSFKKISALFAAASLLALAAPRVQADSQITYAPVKTEKAVSALKPGDKIAVECSACGAITLLTVDKNRSIQHSFECPSCKTEFHTKVVGESGKMHTSGEYVLVDKKGHTAHVAVAK